MVNINKILETLIGNSRGFEIFENPTKKELNEITSYLKRGEVRAIYDLNKGKIYIWEMSHVHNYIIRDYFLDEQEDLVKMILDYKTGNIKFIDLNDRNREMFSEAIKDDPYLKNMSKIFTQLRTVNETLLKRKKYKELDLNVDPYNAQNIDAIKILKNKTTNKEYIEKGYSKSRLDFIRREYYAAYEYIGYYVANKIIRNYNLEGFSVPMPKGLTVVMNGHLKLLIDRAPGKMFLDLRLKGDNTDDEREVSFDRTRLIAYPFFDVMGYYDTHQGNALASKSGKINYIDFEGAFGSGKKTNTFLIDEIFQEYNNVTKVTQIMYKKFMRNLLRLDAIDENTFFSYVDEAIKKIYISLKNEKTVDREELRESLVQLFNFNTTNETCKRNIRYVKKMANYLRGKLEEKNINLTEAMKFPSKKYTVSKSIGVKKDLIPLNISKISKVKNKKNKKVYIKKGYSDSFFDHSVAAVFEYAAYSALKAINKISNQIVRIPNFFALNLNTKLKEFELLTSVDFKNAVTANQTSSKNADAFIDNVLLPASPILILLGHFDVHSANIIVSKSNYYLIDFERAFTNTIAKNNFKARTDAFRYMEKHYFNKIENAINNFYSPDFKSHLKKNSLMKLVKNINSLNINEIAITILSSLNRTERHALNHIKNSALNDVTKDLLKEKVLVEMKDVKKSIHDNYKYMENYIRKLKASPNFSLILNDFNKVTTKHEKAFGTGIRKTHKTSQ